MPVSITLNEGYSVITRDNEYVSVDSLLYSQPIPGITMLSTLPEAEELLKKRAFEGSRIVQVIISCSQKEL